MKKRMLSLLLAITLLIPCLPAQPVRAEITSQEDLESIIAQQYDAYVKSLKPEGASEGAAQLIKHSIKGGGTLHMDEHDKFTKAVLSSQLLRADFIHVATTAAMKMQEHHSDQMFIRGSLQWYEHKMAYNGKAYTTDNEEDKTLLNPIISTSKSSYTGPINTYDEGLFLVGGSVRSRFSFRQIEKTNSTFSYQVTIRLMDVFDFQNGGYNNSSNADLAQTITWLGMLLSMGMLTTFDWTAEASFTITVPNTCSHTSANYLWEYDGVNNLVNVADNENRENMLVRKEGKTDDHIFIDTVYQANSKWCLIHDRPWDIEFRIKGKGKMLFAEDFNPADGGFYAVITYRDVYIGKRMYLTEESTSMTPTAHGIRYTKVVKHSYEEYHVFRLSNRIFDDGSNMVYLYIDNVEIGPLDQYYQNGGAKGTYSDWLNGKDITFSYIGNSTNPISDLQVDYIQVWENGKDNAPYDYCITKELESTCTEDGGNAQVCSLCDAVVSLTNVKPALGHSFGPWQLVREATCDREGQEKRVCSTCGEAETRQLPKPDHVFPEEWTVSQEATCKAEGEERKACQNCGEEQTRKLPKADHNYIPEVVAPTCYSQGYTLHTCKWCGNNYKDTPVNALGHKPGTFVSDGNVTCTKDGTMSAECTRCDMRLTITEEATGHKYENGICTVCGEKDENYTEKFSLYGSSMTLGNALDMNFFVYQSDIEGTGNYAVITKHYADGREDAVVKVEQENWNTLRSAYYYFTFSGVRAKEMADKVEVVIYNADGEAISEVFTDSVQDYARRMLDNPETIATHRTLYIEMLNYGAAAQAEFKYDVDNLANSIITEEEQNAYGMSDRTYENQRQNDDAYYGTTLTLENQIVFNIFYNGSYVPEGAYAVATFTNHKGEKKEEKVETFRAYGTYQYVSFQSLVVADCSELITVTLYDADGNVISTVTDSIEGYAARMTEVGPLYDAIMKFADAAYQYFHS